jgi:hypothetical protein
MVKYRNKLFAAASAIVAAGAVAVSGLTAASASPAASHRVAGTEHLQIVIGSPSARTASVIAYGVFTVGGADNVSMGNTAATVRFPGGTFKIKHSPGHGTQSFNPGTCLLTVNFHGTYTLGHGTGKYAGISGHGKYKISILAIAARSGGRCSQTKRPLAYQQIIRAQGPVHL